MGTGQASKGEKPFLLTVRTNLALALFMLKIGGLEVIEGHPGAFS